MNGLRREELAGIAGVSRGYYIRLEQGRAPHPSVGVVDALARALRLSGDEHAYLRALGDADGSSTAPRSVERMEPGMRAVLDHFEPGVAALVLGRIGDVLGWNTTAAALFPHRLPAPGEEPDRESNNVRYVFENPAARTFFANWETMADETVGHLRATAGRLVHDPDLAALIAELRAASPDFAARWARRDVQARMTGQRDVVHPIVGPLTVDFQVMHVGGARDQALIVYTGADSASNREKMRCLQEVPGRQHGERRRTAVAVPTGT